ncbi:nucleotidyltransferase [Candidatus Woesearchaeota archaeon]|nr:nucleotidyltransferase [Candidatus Woesearchaeota archaeon]
MANIIPMAGLGSRFSEQGYSTPKPLIPVLGVPMIIRAIRSMPQSDKWIFIVRQEHIQQHHLDEVIKNEIPPAIIIAVNTTTLGQANTCLLAQGYVLPDEPLFIAACDNGYVYDKKKYEKLMTDPSIDCVLWTFTQMEKMRRNPHAYGWARLDEDGMTIKDMSVKIPISKDPYYDHAVVATFYFKKAKDFFDAVNLMITENHRIKNEFYVDAVPIFLRKLNKRSVIFDVERWICWGTPDELKEFELEETSRRK